MVIVGQGIFKEDILRFSHCCSLQGLKLGPCRTQGCTVVVNRRKKILYLPLKSVENVVKLLITSQMCVIDETVFAGREERNDCGRHVESRRLHFLTTTTAAPPGGCLQSHRLTRKRSIHFVRRRLKCVRRWCKTVRKW